MASAARTTSGAGAHGCEDCENEEQEDPSSSNKSEMEVNEALDKLNLNDVNKDIEEELAVFRQEWKRELVSAPSLQKEIAVKSEPKTDEEPLTEEEKAKQIFRLGVEMERGGMLYEAIQQYKRAIQILPDVENRVYEGSDFTHETSEEKSKPVQCSRVEYVADSDDEDAVEGEDMISSLRRILAKKYTLFEPEFQIRGGHISWLPYEVIQVVLRWVVGTDLDAAALERVASVCRGLYVAARDDNVWRCMCVSMWGKDCNTPSAHGFLDWRQMYIERKRVMFHGCYISKTTYIRYGENSFQDSSYRPWHLINYYRYLRFFPEGHVLWWTTEKEPTACIEHLSSREADNNLGIMSGRYHLAEGMVIIVVKNKVSEKKPLQASTRFRSRRRVYEQRQHIFHIELELRNVRRRRNWQLVWRRFDVSTSHDCSSFDLTPNKFPPFSYSPVRRYSANTTAPLHHYST